MREGERARAAKCTMNKMHSDAQETQDAQRNRGEVKYNEAFQTSVRAGMILACSLVLYSGYPTKFFSLQRKLPMVNSLTEQQQKDIVQLAKEFLEGFYTHEEFTNKVIMVIFG